MPSPTLLWQTIALHPQNPLKSGCSKTTTFFPLRMKRLPVLFDLRSYPRLRGRIYRCQKFVLAYSPHVSYFLGGALQRNSASNESRFMLVSTMLWECFWKVAVESARLENSKTNIWALLVVTAAEIPGWRGVYICTQPTTSRVVLKTK